jgi:hypothetical protein
MPATPTDFLPDDLDSVLQLLEYSENEWADMAALHGGWGKWNDQRKRVLAECALELRKGAPPESVSKWTDAILDTASHAHPTYKKFLDDSIEEDKRFRRLSAKRDRMMMKARSLTYNPVR